LVFTVMEAGLHMTVRGLVQGVGFRYFVLQKAHALGLRGYVRNHYDGSVEIVAEGERGLLEDLLAAARRGPRSAAVHDVTVEWTDATSHYSDFEVR
jgi:acylphosphatase